MRFDLSVTQQKPTASNKPASAPTNGAAKTANGTAKAAVPKKAADTKAAPGKAAPPSKRATRYDSSRDLDRYTVKPEFWDRILDSLPPWGDEIAAIMLIVFGIVSFLSLLRVSSDATISTAWSNALTSLFGWGSVVVSAGIFALGIVVLLPKLGIVIRFPRRRILALEAAFLSMLALLHLLSGQTELRALARAGEGGGQIGWALSTMIVSLFGSVAAIVFYAVIFSLSVLIVAGVRPERIKVVLKWLHARLGEAGQRLTEQAEANRAKRAVQEFAPPPDPLGTALNNLSQPYSQRTPTSTILRIRADRDLLPPSLRNSTYLPDDDEDEDEEAESASESMEPLNTFNAIGTIKGKKTKTGVMVVERPDGRLKRYFTVDSLKEPKVSARRNPALPPIELLNDIELNLPDEDEINRNVVLIENTLLEFDIDVDVVDVKVGPTVTQYAVQPFREKVDEEGAETVTSRTRVNKIASLASDLALALSARRLRIEAPVPGHTYIGIEVPNRQPSIVAMRSVYESKSHAELVQKSRSPLVVPLGRDVAGTPVSVDLTQMPHLLIAGTTGSGKSVCMAAIASALVLANTPETLRLVMLDPKMVELSRFNGLPHLLGPVETDQERIIGVLRWLTREMDRRYKLLEQNAARNIDSFNAKLGRRRKEEGLPYMVVMIDEVGDLMMAHPDETEKTITRLAQMARAVGIHLIVATQRPSVDVITGLIKANFPSRMSFAVASGTDSRVILDVVGAENLMGKGDLLFAPADAMAPRRIQGCYVSDDEVREIVEYWKNWKPGGIAPVPLKVAPATEGDETEAETESVPVPAPEPIVSPWEHALTRREVLSETDPMLEQAITLVVAEGEASASLIQRRLGLGYPRAARIMDLLQQLGIVGEVKQGGRSREVLIAPGQDPFKDLLEKRMKGGE